MNSTRLKHLIPALLIALSGFIGNAFSQNSKFDSLFLRKIYDVALTNGSAYANLYTLCKEAPARLSGSTNAAKAVDLTLKMLQLVADTSWLQETMVPHWERGEKEVGHIVKEWWRI